MTENDDKAEIQTLERKHGKRFLQMALHADAMRWRQLVAPNRAHWRHQDHSSPLPSHHQPGETK